MRPDIHLLHGERSRGSRLSLGKPAGLETDLSAILTSPEFGKGDFRGHSLKVY